MPRSKKSFNALFAAGGTGGHLFPAMAVAERLRDIFKNDFHAEFVGTANRIESKAVPNAGYDFSPMPIAGFKGIFSISTLTLPFKIRRSISICRKLIKEKSIDMVLCTGAYISYPAGVAAQKENIPLVLMESNLTPGKAIRMLSDRADLIITAFAGSRIYYPEQLHSKIKPLGNPVRQSIIDLPAKEDGIKTFGLDPAKNTILIFGGSLGARSINDAAEILIKELDPEKFQFIWQTGKHYHDKMEKMENLRQLKFIDDMASAYSAADLIISRSGATTTSEICISGKPSILVPFPAASNNEQELNARHLQENAAAILMYEETLSDDIVKIVEDLFRTEKDLKAMAEAAKSLAKPNATNDAAQAVIDLVDKL